MAQPPIKTLRTSLDKLDLSQSTQKAKPKATDEPLDSWEDDSGSATETETDPKSPLQPTSSSTSTSASDIPSPPPPTPISPSAASARNTSTSSTHTTLPPQGYDSASNSSSGASTPAHRAAAGGEDKRPEKSTAVASRLIAAGLGQKAPKRTKEQREYDQAMKVQEKRKRDAVREEERRREQEKERAKRDMWGD